MMAEVQKLLVSVRRSQLRGEVVNLVSLSLPEQIIDQRARNSVIRLAASPLGANRVLPTSYHQSLAWSFPRPLFPNPTHQPHKNHAIILHILAAVPYSAASHISCHRESSRR